MKTSDFDIWWDSWLEENHYYESKEVDPDLIEQLEKVAKAAWDFQQEKIEDIYADQHCNDRWLD